MDTHPNPADLAGDDRARGQREADARHLLLAAADVDLVPPPWRPPPVPPSAVDLLQLALWWSGRNAGAPSAGAAAGDPAGVARAALTLLPAARDELDGLEAAVLFTARAAGLTWAQMATALGMNSPQACQQRYDRLTGRRGRGAQER